MVVWMAAAVLLGLMLGCPDDEPVDDDDDTTAADDDTADEPGGQIEGDEQLSFAVTDVGVMVSGTVEIVNTGIQPLVISTVLVTGPSAAFSVAFDDEVTVAGEGDVILPLEVTFTPDEARLHEASLVIISSAFNAGGNDPFTVALSGQGVEDLDGDEYSAGEDYDEPDADCDDTDPAIHPGADEACDGLDNDCDGGVDNEDDADGDGATECDVYPDCDDGDPYTHPAWVDPGASGGSGTNDLPYGSMQDAVDSSHCGTVLLRAGSYYEGQTVSVTTGEVSIVSVDGPLAAEIDGGGQFRLLDVVLGPVTLQDVMLVDGYDPNDAGGIHASDDLVLQRCAFHYNRSDDGGGAVFAENAVVTVEDGEFFMNEGQMGGGILAQGSSSDLTVTNTLFAGNDAVYGGGLSVHDGILAVEDSIFLLNTGQFGGGVSLHAPASSTITGCDFQSNTTPLDEESGGAAIALQDVSNLSIDGCSFADNVGVVGGAVFGYASTIYADGVSFKDNHADGNGGAVCLEGSLLSVERGQFVGNSADGDGGAIHGAQWSPVTVGRSELLGNTATSGGAISVRDGDLAVHNSVFDANEGDGGAIVYGGSDLVMSYVTLFDNRAPAGSGAVWIDEETAVVAVSYSIFADNEPYALACGGAVSTWDHNDVHGSDGTGIADGCTVDGGTSMASDPMFTSASSDAEPLNDDLHLQPFSPCVDVGPEGCLDLDGSWCDLGAYGGDEPL